MSKQKNDKRKPMWFVSAIPEFIGVMAGISVVAGKWIERHVKGLLGEKPDKPKHGPKTSVQIDAEKRIAAIEQEMTGKKQSKKPQKDCK